MLDMPVPSDRIHFEDIEVGRTVRFGEKLLLKDEIIAYARAFDPQPIHLDEEAAKSSIVGGLCASGFHSCAILMRMLADDVLTQSTSLGSPGMDEVKWMKPVRPGDRLSARFTCSEKRTLASRPDVGLARLKLEMVDAGGDPYMSWDTIQLLQVRNPAAVRASGSEPRPKPVSLWARPGPEPIRTGNFFEDRQLGETYSLGEHTFTRDDIMAFARQFDPQPFHLDEDAGKRSLFGGLAASGWHTTSIWIRQFVRFRQELDAELRGKALPVAQYGPSPGFKSLAWYRPVLAGDTIEYRGRVAAKLDWRNRPDRGLIETENQGRNQRGEIVFAITGRIFAERRHPLKA